MDETQTTAIRTGIERAAPKFLYSTLASAIVDGRSPSDFLMISPSWMEWKLAMRGRFSSGFDWQEMEKTRQSRLLDIYAYQFLFLVNLPSKGRQSEK
ncbi:hypothetical protein ND861_17420 [Leptospira sp. 2 VSF19]|uniref:Uncharacterized protein n=1 Tax=Leptospira soteropolitanensis TaxID=2950025 RepID=A0ABT3MMM2_9LEPT|nr:hypothetical protein [Leptospira soteropolitanensis]MCW7494430.1 hypothetical protein [Leptospira soteropolitanensis]MCW7524276.1 hypothetical protein [Leptospira soteropolitanensis]MCW7528141.1 hypothetical protein [Leptospira soteropolitanensis]